jgi:hypothetical protein
MILALQYWKNDEPQALRLARLLADIEPKHRDDVTLALVRRHDCELSEEAEDTQLYCGKKFPTALMRAEEKGEGWPGGSNALWRGTMELCSLPQFGATGSAVFTFEADCVPLSADWINRLKAEHAITVSQGKRITGAVQAQPCAHVNGNMVIESSAWIDLPSLRQAPANWAWDCWHSATLLRETRHSGVILNAAHSDGWTEGPMLALAREAAILHGCKDDSAFNVASSMLADPKELTVDFFLVTYPKDYPWLPYLFRSIDVHVTGFRKLVLVIEEQDPPPADLPPYVEVKRCRNYRGTDYPGYFGQCIEGLRSWQYSDASRIWFLESDCVFTRDIDLLTDKDYPIRKPLLPYTDWDLVGDAQCWKEPAHEILRCEPPAETMRRHPFVYPRRLIREAWSFVGCEARLLTFPKWSQFNCLGNFALIKRPEQFTPVETSLGTVPLPDDVNASQDSDDLPPPCIKQWWSHHTPDHPDIQAELKRMGLARG